MLMTAGHVLMNRTMKICKFRTFLYVIGLVLVAVDFQKLFCTTDIDFNDNSPLVSRNMAENKKKGKPGPKLAPPASGKTVSITHRSESSQQQQQQVGSAIVGGQENSHYLSEAKYVLYAQGTRGRRAYTNRYLFL